MQTIVIGHRNPDMDAIVSAIGYAELKRQQGQENTVAGRCGPTNERIDFVLQKFNTPAPMFIPSVRPMVGDVMETEVVSARENEPVYRAMERIGEKRFRGLPVVDFENRCLGLISGFKINDYLFPPRETVERSREVHASLRDINTVIHGECLTGEPSRELRRHVLVVAAMQTDSFVRRLQTLPLADTVLIIGDRLNIQRIAIEAGVRAMILTGGFGGTEEILDLARARGVCLLSSPHDTATTVLLARSGVQSSGMLDPKFESLRADVPLEEARREVALSSQFAFPVLDHDGKLQGIISKSDFLKPIPRQLILVDHNEMPQAVAGASEIPIVEILDHHRLGTIQTEAPILFLNQPVGSTSTIVALQYRQSGIAIPKNIAGLLMAGLISDTLNLTSPTTTVVDRGIMAELEKITGVVPARLAEEIFSVGSPLLTMPPGQAVSADCKIYEERGMSFSVSQIEELSFSHLPERLSALVEALEDYREKNGLFVSALLVTDVNTQNSILLLRGDARFLQLVDYPEADTFAWKLDGVVSRKKQLLPYLTKVLGRLA